MDRIVIFGNSGAGKSTLAKKYSAIYDLSHLDLDTLAWKKTVPPERKAIQESTVEINRFLSKNPRWVIEGCYADLLNIVLDSASKIIFLNPGTEACIENSKKRPWEPHKYASIEEQNQNLEMLIEWIKEYPVRNDEFSYKAHSKLYEEFPGEKEQFTSNQ